METANEVFQGGLPERTNEGNGKNNAKDQLKAAEQVEKDAAAAKLIKLQKEYNRKLLDVAAPIFCDYVKAVETKHLEALLSITANFTKHWANTDAPEKLETGDEYIVTESGKTTFVAREIDIIRVFLSALNNGSRVVRLSTARDKKAKDEFAKAKAEKEKMLIFMLSVLEEHPELAGIVQPKIDTLREELSGF